MTLTETLTEHIHACFTGLWIETLEPDEALREIHALCREEEWNLMTWNASSGLEPSEENVSPDPITALESLETSSPMETPTLLVLSNLHRMLGSLELIEKIRLQIEQGRFRRNFLVVLSPVVQIPEELAKSFVVLQHPLPDRKQLEQIAREVATEEGELTEAELTTLLDASAGLTRYEAEGAFALSLVRHGRLQPEVLWELKSQTLKQSGALHLENQAESFESLGGMEGLKSFCRRSLTANTSGHPALGVMLLGVPGTGKSAFCRALGHEVGRPTLVLDIGALMGSLVGQTEANLRKALRQIDAMAPSVVMIDEVEKALSGNRGQQDSGVASRLFGTLLSWLSDRTSDTYVVCTCNDISRLPPEFARAERFDGIFFLDLPSATNRQSIWEIYRGCYEIPDDPTTPQDEQWTGAEIRACCRLGRLLDLPLEEAADHVVPVARTASETVQQLRRWATGRCLDAESGTLYQGPASSPSRKRPLGVTMN